MTVNEGAARVVVEDVRSGRRAVAPDLPAVGAQIARLLEASSTPDGPRPPEGSFRELGSGRSSSGRGADPPVSES